MTVTLGKVTPGHIPGPHAHEYEQLVFILQGECDFYVDGKPYRLGPGCVMAVPPDGGAQYRCPGSKHGYIRV